MWTQVPATCPYCIGPLDPTTDHILRCARAPWNRQPVWQVGVLARSPRWFGLKQLFRRSR